MKPRRFVLVAIIAVAVLLRVAGDIPAYADPTGQCGYYTNSRVDKVPRPCGNWHTQAPPPGATAECRDGTYSWSEHPHASWTCSYHGGVAAYR
jgi:Protein of unknown function (DUF3761)